MKTIEFIPLRKTGKIQKNIAQALIKGVFSKKEVNLQYARNKTSNASKANNTEKLWKLDHSLKGNYYNSNDSTHILPRLEHNF
jgi:transcriptional regulator